MTNGSTNLVHRVELARDIMREVARADFGSLSDSELKSAMSNLLDASKYEDASRVACLAELDARRVTTRSDRMTTSAWLAREARIPAKEAFKQTHVAQVLQRDFPVIGTALADGDVSLGQVELLVDVTTHTNRAELKEKQTALVELAKESVGYEPYETGLKFLVNSIERESGYDPAEDVNANVLFQKPRLDGGVDISAVGYGARAVALQQSIRDRANRMFHEHKDKGLEIPKRATLEMLALYEINDDANNNGQVSHPRGTPEKKRKRRPPRAGVTFIYEVAQPITDIHESGSARITKRQAKELLCDPEVHDLFVNSKGVPLKLGAKRRLASPAQRRVLEARDGGCAHPNCDSPVSWCEAHHVVHWEDQGPTDVDNLVLLCKTHHGVAHSEGVELRARTISYNNGDHTGPFEWVADGVITPSATRRSKRQIAKQIAGRISGGISTRLAEPDEVSGPAPPYT